MKSKWGDVSRSGNKNAAKGSLAVTYSGGRDTNVSQSRIENAAKGSPAFTCFVSLIFCGWIYFSLWELVALMASGGGASCLQFSKNQENRVLTTIQIKMEEEKG